MKNSEFKSGISPDSVLQIGLGAFGTHLKPYLEQNFAGVVTVACRIEPLPKDLSRFKYVFLSVQDTELSDLVEKLAALNVEKIVHFSGFHYFKEALGVHPVCSFSKEGSYDLSALKYVADGELFEGLKTLFPKASFLNPGLKKDYHSYLSVTANSMQLLVHQMSQKFESDLGLDSDLLREIVLQSLEREKKYGADSFSGPWVRGEKKAQDQHVESMDSSELINLNRFFLSLIESFNKNQKKETVYEHPSI